MVRDVEAINWPFKGHLFFVETVQDTHRCYCCKGSSDSRIYDRGWKLISSEREILDGYISDRMRRGQARFLTDTKRHHVSRRPSKDGRFDRFRPIERREDKGDDHSGLEKDRGSDSVDPVVSSTKYLALYTRGKI